MIHHHHQRCPTCGFLMSSFKVAACASSHPQQEALFSTSSSTVTFIISATFPPFKWVFLSSLRAAQQLSRMDLSQWNPAVGSPWHLIWQLWAGLWWTFWDCSYNETLGSGVFSSNVFKHLWISTSVMNDLNEICCGDRILMCPHLWSFIILPSNPRKRRAALPGPDLFGVYFCPVANETAASLFFCLFFLNFCSSI